MCEGFELKCCRLCVKCGKHCYVVKHSILYVLIVKFFRGFVAFMVTIRNGFFFFLPFFVGELFGNGVGIYLEVIPVSPTSSHAS